MTKEPFDLFVFLERNFWKLAVAFIVLNIVGYLCAAYIAAHFIKKFW